MRMTSPLFVCLMCIGCSSEPSRYPVSGAVTIDGIPAPLTLITFIAIDPSTPTSSGGAAITDESGNFTVKGKDKEPGLMAGEYKVVFQQSLINGKPTLGGTRGKKDKAPGETEGVPSEYLDPETTPIRITVKKNMEPCQFALKK